MLVTYWLLSAKANGFSAHFYLADGYTSTNSAPQYGGDYSWQMYMTMSSMCTFNKVLLKRPPSAEHE